MCVGVCLMASLLHPSIVVWDSYRSANWKASMYAVYSCNTSTLPFRARSSAARSRRLVQIHVEAYMFTL